MISDGFAQGSRISEPDYVAKNGLTIDSVSALSRHRCAGTADQGRGILAGMDDLTDDDRFLDAVDAIVLDPLTRIGN